MYTEKNLVELKQKIDTAKSETERLKGRHDELMKQLQDSWQCTTIEQAEQKVEKLNKEISTLQKEIEEGLLDLEQLFE